MKESDISSLLTPRCDICKDRERDKEVFPCATCNVNRNYINRFVIHPVITTLKKEYEDVNRIISVSEGSNI